MWFLWLYSINVILIFLIAIREVRRPANALVWILTCLLIPIFGFLFYLIATNPVSISRRDLLSQQEDYLPDSLTATSLTIAKAIQRFTVNQCKSGAIEILANGLPTYDRLIQSIRSAKRTIDMEYYIFRNDHIGSTIVEELIKKAEEGVRIRFVRDGWGSRKLPRQVLARLQEAGIACRTIHPLRFPWLLSNLNYRDHCKIVVIDGEEAYTGGINIGDEYTGLKPGVGFWRDTHMRLTGDSVRDLQFIFQAHWNMASQEKRLGAPHAKRLSLKGRPEWATEFSAMPSMPYIEHSSEPKEGLHEALIQTIEGNPAIPTQTIRQVYFICLTQAKQSIDVCTPYFIPDDDIISALKAAASRGVRVRLLVPLKTDEKIVGLASQTYFGELIEAGVHVLQYSKGILHAKLMIIDGEVSEVGASNCDMRSFRLNYEVCQIIYSKKIAEELTTQFDHDLIHAVPLTMEDLTSRSAYRQAFQQAARLLAPLL